MQQKQLSKRLRAVAEFLPACDCIADIGCDHGMLGLYLLQSGKCQTLLAIDISGPSLQKAGRLYERFGLENRAKTVLHNGFPPSGGFQAAAIAGIGGDAAIRILLDGLDAVKGLLRLVLQPADDAAKLRRWLAENGFEIQSECIVYEGRYFPVIAARYDGLVRRIDDLASEIGPRNQEHPDSAVLDYARWRMRVWKKTLRKPAETFRGKENQQQVARLVRSLEKWYGENADVADAQTDL